MSIKIRPFRQEDLESVLVLANKYASFDGETSEADLAVAAHFPDGFLVAEDHGRIVGFAYGYFKDVPEHVLERWRVKKVGYVQLMAVATDYRRTGIGESLLRRLLEEFKKAGANLVLLDCPAEAVEAKRLYEKMGFDTRFYGMKKRISPASRFQPH